MNFIMPILLGAVIGYITNWLAIKMLFRPHHEKKLFGLRIPFTPGLIPKEINRIAKSVGDTIGTHLLSPEIVTETLSNNLIGYKIEKWIENNIDGLRNNNITIREFLITLLGDNYSKLSNTVLEKLTHSICFHIKKEEFVESLMGLIENKVYNKYSEDIYKAIKEKAELLIYKISTSEEIETGLKCFIEDKISEWENDERTLKEAMPESIIHAINSYIIRHSNDISSMLMGILKSPTTSIKLKNSISELVLQNTNKIIALFISPKLATEKIFAAIENYISNPKNNKDIATISLATVSNILQNKIANLVRDISPENMEEYTLKIVEIISNYISDRGNQSKVVNLAEKGIMGSKENIKESLLDVVSDKVKDILESPELCETISIFLSYLINMVLNEPVSIIMKDIDKENITNIAGFIKDVFSGLIENKLPHLIEMLNISKVVEERINGFDVAFAEEIIVEIANKELKAITWLGALLGGIMGVLLPLLQKYI